MQWNNDNDAPLLRAIPTFAAVGIGRSQAYRMMNAGTVPAVKLNRATYIRRADWDAYIATLPAYRVGAASAAKSGVA